MSEKRILIQEYDENPCLSCTNDCKYPCEAKREWVLGAGIKGPEKNYKRSEAIEKMAKGIGWAFDPYKPAKEEYDNIWNNVLLDGTKKHYKDVAEAALNALLEGKK